MFLIRSLAEAGWELGGCGSSAELRRQQRVLAARHVPLLLPGVKPLCLRAADVHSAGSTASGLACPCPTARLILCASIDCENKLRSRVIRNDFAAEEAALIQRRGAKVMGSSGALQRLWHLLAHGTQCWDAFSCRYRKTTSKNHPKLLLGSTAPCKNPNPSAEEGAPRLCRNRLLCDHKINFWAKFVTAAQNCGNR